MGQTGATFYMTEENKNQTTGRNQLETVDQDAETVPWWDIIPEHNTQLDLNEALQSDKHVIVFPSINTAKYKIEVNISMYYPLNAVRKLRVMIELGSLMFLLDFS